MLSRADMIWDPYFYLVAVLAVGCLGLSKGGFVGFGLVATPLLASAIPPMQAVAILLPIMLLQDFISAWAYRRNWDARNLAVILPGAMLGLCAAWLIAAWLPDVYVRLAVGLIGLAFALKYWFIGEPVQEQQQPAASRGVFWGAVSGFTGTLANAGGPPLLTYLLPQKLEKLTLVATLAVFFAILNAIKILPISALGQFSKENLTTSLLLLPLAVAASLLGIWLVRKVPTNSFYKISYVLVSCVSVGLIWQSVSALLER